MVFCSLALLTHSVTEQVILSRVCLCAVNLRSGTHILIGNKWVSGAKWPE